MHDLRERPRSTFRPLDREEIDRRLRASIDSLLTSLRRGRSGDPVAISAADIVRLARSLTSRN